MSYNPCTMSTIDWVLFDLGGVLLHVEQPRTFQRLGALTDIPSSEIERRLKGAPFFQNDFIVREFTPSEVAERVNQLLETRLEVESIVDALNAELGGEIATTSSVLPALQRRVQVGCLSNTNSIHWDKLLQSYSFMRAFDRRFASQILGYAKPGFEIYTSVAAHLGAQPRQILFIDDKLENVESARRLGWHARVYTGEDQLLADLHEFKAV